MSIEGAAARAAGVGVRLLRGVAPASISVRPQLSEQAVYDARELRRWGISESRLPAGSSVLFRQPGVWDQYRSYIVGAVVILALQSALIAGLIVQRGRRRRMELALRRSYEQNQNLAGQLINAQEAERARIARDLHDDVSQQIAGFGIMLSTLRRRVGKPGAEASVEESVTALQARTSSLAQSVRNLSHQLHPSVLEHAGLVATLLRHCTEVEEHQHIAVVFGAEGDFDSLDRDVSFCLFRVGQEALANAVRHANARSIRVQLTEANDGVELQVADDGVGFVASEQAASGLGLRSIDERVRLTGGSVQVTSQPGQGTTLSVRVPIAATQITGRLPAGAGSPSHQSLTRT